MTWPFRQVTEGRGFIIVGMGYLERGFRPIITVKAIGQYGRRHAESLKKVLSNLQRHLRIDAKQMFIGGFSKGGVMSTVIGEASIDMWAGLLVIGGGRIGVVVPGADPKGIRGKPIYIGVGEKDRMCLPDAVRTQRFYRGAGAKVTFEKYPNLGHFMDTRSKALRNWLLTHGPLKNLEADLAAAKAAEEAGRRGEAYALYHKLGQASRTNEDCLKAARAAGKLAARAGKRLAEARAAVAGKKYTGAVKLLVEIAETYRGSAFASDAKERLAAMESDPAIKDLFPQARLDARADALEARARAAEGDRDYTLALRLYGQYVASFQAAQRYGRVKAHLAGLKADKQVASAIRRQQADRECPKLLDLADNYISARVPDKARACLESILAKYSDTRWADEARRRLKTIAKDD